MFFFTDYFKKTSKISGIDDVNPTHILYVFFKNFTKKLKKKKFSMINFDYYVRDKRETDQEGLPKKDIFP